MAGALCLEPGVLPRKGIVQARDHVPSRQEGGVILRGRVRWIIYQKHDSAIRVFGQGRRQNCPEDNSGLLLVGGDQDSDAGRGWERVHGLKVVAWDGVARGAPAKLAEPGHLVDPATIE